MKYYVVIDLEMCKVPKGAAKSYGKSNEVIQIGAVALDEQYQILEDRFMTYVKPQYGSLDSFINHLTGITQKDLKEAPCFEEALRQFESWLPDGEVEMVSWSRTDLKQLQNEMKGKNIVSERFEQLFETWNDCQKTFSNKMEKKRAYSLEEALIATSIMQEGQAHDGLADAYNTALLFAKMAKEPHLKLNPIYEEARSENVNHLTVSMGEFFGKIDFSSLPEA